MIAVVSDPVVIDSGDRIAGYPVIHQHPLPDGRVVVVDRGAQYVQRYVVAWHRHNDRGWCDATLFDRLDVAVEVFCLRAKGARKARE